MEIHVLRRLLNKTTTAGECASLRNTPFGRCSRVTATTYSWKGSRRPFLAASRLYSTELRTVHNLPSWDLTIFRDRAFIPKLPVLLPQDASKEPPASSSWFQSQDGDHSLRNLNYTHLTQFGDAIVPLELTRNHEAGNATFERFNAPLSLFLDWMRKQQNLKSDSSSSRLYLAQCQISALPKELQDDLPTPEIVLKAGKGDVYGANIWIGVPPTYTPLHRDPNPNFFLQLAGTKVVRLFPPNAGREIFAAVQEKLGASGNAMFRGEEMMQGQERDLLEKEVWADGGEKLFPEAAVQGYEATVGQGNALFIPLGWWHSIRGIGERGVTASVNWWFR
jgi:Cupin-like domain